MRTKAERIRQANVPTRDARFGDRLPPGQVVTDRFPILHEGEVPQYDLATWDLRVFGDVGEERSFSFQNLMALRQDRVVADIHCVTRWSKFDTAWEGVLFSTLLEQFDVHPEARYVALYGDHDYDTVLPLDDLVRPDVLLAHHYDEEPLTPKHGWPLRLVVPHLYFWKSVKWLRGIELIRSYRPGYWEQRGFHDYGDPFEEQRFSGEDLLIPEDEWTKKDYD